MPKTIEDIIPPSRRRMMEARPLMPQDPDHLQSIGDEPPQYPRTPLKTGKGFPYGTALVALLVIGISAAALILFSGARVEVTPTSQNADVSGAFTATAGSGDLPFTVISVTKVASASLPAENTETANDSAQGSIIISNAQSTAQTLINNTRFQAASGLIYRVHNPISIPAAFASGPGTVTVPVYADQPGQQYDVDSATFTVPGLQGSDAFKQVTAKSVGPITGGFSGTRASVGQATSDKQHTALQVALATDLQSQITAKIPKDSVLVPGSSITSYQALPDVASTTSTVTLREQGTVTAVVFPQDALAKAIAYKSVGTYSGEPVTLDTVSKLILTPSVPASTSTAATDLASASTYSFTLSGSTNIIWKVDTAKIAGAVADKARDSAQSILTSFPEVSHAVLILRPFWASTFPQDPGHIKVTVTKSATAK